MGGTARHTASPLVLLRQAAGSPAEMAAKVRRLARALAAYGDAATLDQRLRRLHELGHIEVIPTRVQLLVGAMDMLRFWIIPCSEDYYRDQDIHFGFHQILRLLDEPASLVDPVGFLSERDGIIGHLMQVVHANPRYDLQLLEAHDRGLDELEVQLEAMLAGRHPRARSIGAIVEEPGYHARLLEYVRDYRRAPDAEPPLRDNVESSPRFRELERTFGTLSGAMRYFGTLPRSPVRAAWHLMHATAPALNPRASRGTR
jgi:hypothetical protein